MSFVLQTPSLQHLAAVKIVAHLCTQRDIFTQIPQPVNRPSAQGEGRHYWTAVEEKVESKVSVLPLPQRCKQQLSNLIAPLAIEFIEWCHFTCNYERNNSFELLDILLPQHICWTMHGTINYAKTAERVVKNEGLSVERRYEIACINCLEDEVWELFQRMDEERQQDYVTGDIFKNGIHMTDLHRLIVFYTRTINGVWDDHLPSMLSFPLNFYRGSINQYLFEYAALFSGNRATCEYLFETLNPDEKGRVLANCRRLMGNFNQSRASNLMFYLSLWNDERERRYLFRECFFGLLICLLHWPMQSLFMEMVKCGRSYMKEGVCTSVLKAIADKISLGFQDYDYVELFLEIWQLSPGYYMRPLLDDFRFLAVLLGAKRGEIIPSILNDASSRQILALCYRIHEIGEALLDESVMSDAALMECHETAALESSNDPQDEEKRLKSQHLSRLIDIVMLHRIGRRGLVSSAALRFP